MSGFTVTVLSNVVMVNCAGRAEQGQEMGGRIDGGFLVSLFIEVVTQKRLLFCFHNIL